MGRHTIARRNLLLAGAGAATLTRAATAAAEPARPARARPLRVQIVMFDGVEELDFAAPFEVFAMAGTDIRYVTAGAPGTVTAAYGTRIEVRHRLAPREADLIVVPGGGYTERDAPGVWAEIERGVLPRALAAAPRRGLTVASVCTGAIVLGAAGLIDGRPCTTHFGAWDGLEEYGGVLTMGRVVDDGDLVTAGGITSGLELALWLVRRELGPEAALNAEMVLDCEARGTVWTASGR